MNTLMFLLIWLGAAAAEPADGARLEHEATLVWRERHADFGGFSAIEVLDEGARFVTVSDRGAWAKGRLIRENGRLTAVEMDRIAPLLGIDGTPLTGWDADAEGLAIDSEGRFWVSFEHFHRIRRYDRIEGPAAHVDGHPDFPNLQRNSGLEALAIDADGTIYAVPERSGALDRPFPVYRKQDGEWDRTLSLPRVGRYLVSGADWGPDGRFWLLEREQGLFGFRSRVRRFALGPDGFGPGEIMLETRWLELDNMEGISVWADAEGVVRVTLIADDNFMWPIQRTLVVEYVLVEG